MKTTQQTKTRQNIAVRIAGAVKQQWQEQQYLQERRIAHLTGMGEGIGRQR